MSLLFFEPSSGSKHLTKKLLNNKLSGLMCLSVRSGLQQSIAPAAMIVSGWSFCLACLNCKWAVLVWMCVQCSSEEQAVKFSALCSAFPVTLLVFRGQWHQDRRDRTQECYTTSCEICEEWHLNHCSHTQAHTHTHTHVHAHTQDLF